MHPDLAVGGVFPDLVLDDHAGNRRRLDEVVGGDPTLLHFYRGWWCPKERAFLHNLLALADEAEVAYTRFVSVSVDRPEVTSAYRAGLGARWLFLCDPDRRWLDRLDLREHTDTLYEPYVPTAFVLRPGRVIHAVWNGYWFWGRPTNEELRQSFREVTRLVRPDWEAPGP